MIRRYDVSSLKELMDAFLREEDPQASLAQMGSCAATGPTASKPARIAEGH